MISEALTMDVTEATVKRHSVRSFLSKPVDNKLLKELLEKASRSPSGGNLQPWKIYVINKSSMERFLEFQAEWDKPETPAYDIYPKDLKEPYKSHSKEVGELMYGALGISRDDKEARWDQVNKNFEFFGAPAALFCFIDRQMGPPQWSDLGMFLQTLMLLAQEAGLDTCAQEIWSMREACVSNFLNTDPEFTIFCGMAIGYKDEEAPINNFRTTRSSIDEWCKFID